MPSTPHIPPRLTESDARGVLLRRKRMRLFGLLPLRIQGRGELVWMTLYLIPFAAKSAKNPGTITVSVEGRSGAFAIFEMHEAIAHGSIDGEIILPTMSEDVAVAHGRQELLHAILRQSSRGRKPVIGDAGAVSRLCYPFWVHYYERRRGRLDIGVIDAITGLPAGGKIKAEILEAFKHSAANERK